MNIAGLIKMTLLDYPEHIACTVFLQGCNFKCPFCYNSSLIVRDTDSLIPLNDFLAFLDQRKNLLDGVAITGGEPLLNPDIVEFIKKIKDKGFKVKLDTNGSYPSMLQKLIDEQLVDYVAMDIKNTFEKYPLTTNCRVNIDDIKQSISILINSSIDYEFRTTVVKQFHNIEDFKIIGENINGAKKYFLQSYQTKDSVLNKDLTPLSKDELQSCLKTVSDYVSQCFIRGID